MGSSSNPKVSLIPFPYAYTSGSVTVNNQVAGGNNSPIGFPTYYADFTQSLPSELTQTSRGSNATMYDSQGRVVFAPANMCSTSSAIAANTGTSVSTSSILGQDGVALKTITGDGATSLHFATCGNVTYVAGQSYTSSVLIASSSNDLLQLTLSGAIVANAYANIQLSTLTATSGGTATAATVVSVPGYGYRVSFTWVCENAGAGFAIIIAGISSIGSARLPTVSFSGVIIAGQVQVEPYDVSSPKAFISTSGSAYYGNRFDTDPFTLQPLGLLLEEARTNLLTYSDQFDNAAWTKSNTTVPSGNINVALSPDGLYNADLIQESSDAGVTAHQLSQNGTVTNAAACVFSVYVKASTRTQIALYINCTGTIAQALFDLTTGIATPTTGSASIQTLTNGWFRCQVTGTANLTTATCIIMSKSGGVDYTGNGSNALYLWGAQLEVAEFSTSYIPTYAASATRSGDWAPWMVTNAYTVPGSLAVEYSVGRSGPTTIFPPIAAFSDNTGSNRHYVFGMQTATTCAPGLRSDVAGVAQYNNAVGTPQNQQAIRHALAWANADWYQASSIGVTVSAAVNNPPTGLTYLAFGSAGVANAIVGSARWIKSFAYYNSRLSNAQVQALATVARSPILSLDLTSQDTRLNWGTSDRGTNAMQYDSLGRLVWAPANMLSYSETAAQWITSGLTSAAYDSTTPPTGATQTVKVLAAAGAGNHCGYRTYTSGVAGATYTFSVFVKAGNQLYIVVGDLGDAAWHTVTIDSSTGAVTNSNSISAPTSTSLGNGWFRVSGSFTRTNAGNISVFVGAVPTNLTTPGYTAGGTEYCYATGLMLEPTGIDSPKAYIPTLATAVYKPRFDYDPATKTALGFLMEEQRTNSLMYSNTLTNVAWATTSSTVTGNTTLSPDGTVNANTMTSAAASAFTAISGSVIGTAAAYTLSVYAKTNGAQYLQLMWQAVINATDYANFDLISGTVTAGTNTAASIQAVGNGWYRCTITSTLAAASGAAYIAMVGSPSAARVTSFAGDGVKGLYLYGAQVELGAFATSYIPTPTTAAATRNADPAPFLPVGSWYYQGGGTLKAQYRFEGMTPASPGINQGIACFSDGSASNTWFIFGRNAGDGTNKNSGFVLTGGVVQATLNDSTAVANTDYKTVFQVTTNSFKSASNGSAVQTDLAGTMPTTVTQLVIGKNYNVTDTTPANGWIKSVSYNLKFDFSDGQLVESTIL